MGIPQGLSGADDRAVLAWAAEQGRILVTHDVETVTRYAFERIDAGLPMPGVVEVIAAAPIGKALQGLALIGECLADSELANYDEIRVARSLPRPPGEGWGEGRIRGETTFHRPGWLGSPHGR